MKNVIILFTVSISILSVVLALRYNQSAFKASDELNNERYLRMTAEESAEQAKAKISSLEAELAGLQSKVDGLEKELEQSKAINADLEIRLKEAESSKSASPKADKVLTSGNELI